MYVCMYVFSYWNTTCRYHVWWYDTHFEMCMYVCVCMYECVYLSLDIVYNNKTNVRIVSTTMVFLSTHIQYRSYTYFLTFPVPTAIKSLIYGDHRNVCMWCMRYQEPHIHTNNWNLKSWHGIANHWMNARSSIRYDKSFVIQCSM